jgi:hypothetical protein
LKISKLGIALSCFISLNAAAIDYITNGSFSTPDPLNGTYTFSTDYHNNGTVTWGQNSGLNGGGGLIFDVQGKRSEILAGYQAAHPYTDVEKGESRWNAFSFKLDSSSKISAPSIIHQMYNEPSGGAKIQFFINKDGDQHYINFAHLIECRHDNWNNLYNNYGEKLCDKKSLKKQVGFQSIPFELDKWFHIRYEIQTDWPDSKQYHNPQDPAIGSLSAAGKPEGGEWKMFWYRGVGYNAKDEKEKGTVYPKYPAMRTFTHDLDEGCPECKADGHRENIPKYGIYGSPSDKVKLFMDEIYSNNHFTALPLIYRN